MIKKLSGLAKKREILRQEHVGASGKNLLLVEGEDDAEAFRILLGNFRSGWETRWSLVPVGGKDWVLALLEKEPSWNGIVDRDEWSDTEVLEAKTLLPNLRVLPRYCMESYLVVPAELWATLPDSRKLQVEGGFGAFEASILELLPKYLRHGALWRSVLPLRAGLQGLGFPGELASDASLEIAQDDAAIQRKLKDWHHYLDPEASYERFRNLLATVLSLPTEDQLKLWVHGKYFWKGVDLLLNQLLGQMDREKRRIGIFRHLPALPTDLELAFEDLVPLPRA